MQGDGSRCGCSVRVCVLCVKVHLFFANLKTSFGYIMTPIATSDSSCRVVMINQSLTRGFIPPFLINSHLHRVLSNYILGYEAHVLRMRMEGRTAQLLKMLASIDLDNEDEDDPFEGDKPTERKNDTRDRGKSTKGLKIVLKKEHDRFTEFVRAKYAGEVLEFYDKCTGYSILLDVDDRKAMALKIIEEHVKDGAWKAVDMPDSVRTAILNGANAETFPPDMFEKAKNTAFLELKANFYHQYVKHQQQGENGGTSNR